MKEGYYILRDKQVVPVSDMYEWGRFLEQMDARRVAQTELSDGTWISTVFLGIDHNWEDGPPLLFETMVFSSKDDMSERYCERYSTYQQAEDGHNKIVKEFEHKEG